MTINGYRNYKEKLNRDLEHFEESLRGKEIFYNNVINSDDKARISGEIEEVKEKIKKTSQEIENVDKLLAVYSEIRKKFNDLKHSEQEIDNNEIDTYLSEINDEIADFPEDYKSALSSSITELANMRTSRLKNIRTNDLENMTINGYRNYKEKLNRDLEHFEESLRGKEIFYNNVINSDDKDRISGEIDEVKEKIQKTSQEIKNVDKLLAVYSEIRNKINDLKHSEQEIDNNVIDNYLSELTDKIADFPEDYKNTLSSSITELENMRIDNKKNAEVSTQNNDDNVKKTEVAKDIDYYRNQLKKDMDELKRLEKYREDLIKGIQDYPYSEKEKDLRYNKNVGMNKALDTVKKDIKNLQNRIDTNNKIVESYDSAIKQAESIRELYRSKFNDAEDEQLIERQIEERKKEIIDTISNLPDNLKADITDYIKKIEEEEKEKSKNSKKELPISNEPNIKKFKGKIEDIKPIPLTPEEKEKINNYRKNKELKGKKWRKALAGAAGFAAGVGLNVVAGSVPVVGAALTVYAAGRTLYNTAKLVNNISTKLNHGEEPKIIKSIRESKINNICKFIFEKPKTENEYAKWFVNGMSLGYLADKVFDISGNIGKAFDSSNAVVPDSTPTPVPDSTPTPTPTETAVPIDNQINNPIKIGDSIDVSTAEYGYVDSLGDGYTHLIHLDGFGKVDQIVNVNGQNMYSILQPNGQGYAWFTEEQVNDMINAATKTSGRSL